MREVKFPGQVVLDLIHQPLVVEGGEHEARRVHQRFHRPHVGGRGLAQARVLHLDRQHPPVRVLRHVHLRQGCRGDGVGVEARKQLLGRRAQVGLYGAPHLADGGHGAAVQEVVAHGDNILLGQQVVQLAHVLPQLGVHAAVGKAQLQQAVSTALVALAQCALALLAHQGRPQRQLVVCHDCSSCIHIPGQPQRDQPCELHIISYWLQDIGPCEP
mmetsp:Transcript_28870/g.73679  ORF Transcript_28870/g.73679 Transcript_28870/m.73679 type:complete len:215 (+) Transcript_28870:1303-1947(+)